MASRMARNEQDFVMTVESDQESQGSDAELDGFKFEWQADPNFDDILEEESRPDPSSSVSALPQNK
jgi:hypothetical protein